MVNNGIRRKKAKISVITASPCVFGRKEVVGAAGFEPATSWSQTKRSTKLSYAPTRTPQEYRPVQAPCNDNFNRQTESRR
jgi:hypothetical protein